MIFGYVYSLREKIFTEKSAGFCWGWTSWYIRTAASVADKRTTLLIHRDNFLYPQAKRHRRGHLVCPDLSVDLKDCKSFMYISLYVLEKRWWKEFIAKLFFRFLATVFYITHGLLKILFIQLHRRWLIFQKTICLQHLHPYLYANMFMKDHLIIRI